MNEVQLSPEDEKYEEGYDDGMKDCLHQVRLVLDKVKQVLIALRKDGIKVYPGTVIDLVEEGLMQLEKGWESEDSNHL